MSRNPYSHELASDFLGIPPLPPPSPIPNPTRRRQRRGKEKFKGHKRPNLPTMTTSESGARIGAGAAPKPTTKITSIPSALNGVPRPRPSPKPTTTSSSSTLSVAKRISTPSVVAGKAPLPLHISHSGSQGASQTRDDEPELFNRKDLRARIRKLLVAHDEYEDLQPSKPKFKAFAVLKKPAAPTATMTQTNNDKGKVVKTIKAKGANILDPSYRPFNTSVDHLSSSEYNSADEEEDPDIGWGLLSRAKTAIGQNSSPPTSVSPPRVKQPQGQPPKQPRPTQPQRVPPPLPAPTLNPNLRKRKRFGDTTYRPSKTSLEQYSSSEFSSSIDEEDPDLDWGLMSAERPAAEQNTPPISLEVEGPSALGPLGPSGPGPSVHRPPPPAPQLAAIPRKRRRIHINNEPNCKPSFESEREESSWEGSDKSDEGIKALRRLTPGKDEAKPKRVKKANVKGEGKEKIEEKQFVQLPNEVEKNGIPPTEEDMEVGNGKQKPTVPRKKKKGKAILDPSYKPPRDEEDSDEYSDYSFTDGGARLRRRRKRVRAQDDGDETKHLADGKSIPSEPEPKLEDSIKPQHKPPQAPEICQAHPCLPPKFGSRKIKAKPPRSRIQHDPSYKPGSTSSDDDISNDGPSGDFGEAKNNRKPRKFQHRALRRLAQTQTVSELHRDEIERMLDGTRPRQRPVPAAVNAGVPAIVPATGIAKASRRQRPRCFRRQTSDGSYRPSKSDSGSGSEEYSDEWGSDSGGWSSGLEFKLKRKGRGRETRKTKGRKMNVSQKPEEPGIEAGTEKEDLQNGNPRKETEETQGQATAQPVNNPPHRKRKGTSRRVPHDRDRTYHPSTDSYSSESEFGAGSDSDLDHSLSRGSLKVRNGFMHEKTKRDHSVPSPELSDALLQHPKPISQPQFEAPLSPVTSHLEANHPHPQPISFPRSLTNIKTAFYPLCNPRYTPWPPPAGTVYCLSCFREQVIVRGLLVRQGITETLRVLKTSLGDGEEFGRELDEALERVWRGVERAREKMRKRRRLKEGDEEEEDDDNEGRGRGQKGQMDDAPTKLDPVVSGQPSYLPKLPEDVQTLVVLRRLVDLINVNTTRGTQMSTERPSHPDTSPKKPLLLPSPSVAITTTTVFPKRTSIYHVTGPSRYSSPFPPPRHPHLVALIPQGGDAQRTGRTVATLSTDVNISIPLPSLHAQNPLDKAINTFHDAVGISPWQARRLWNRYEGRRIWEVARVDSLVERVCRANAELNGGEQVLEKLLKGTDQGEYEDTEIELGNDENDRMMLGLEVARLEEAINDAFAEAEKKSRKEEVEGRTRPSDGNGATEAKEDAQSAISNGTTTSQDERKRPRDQNDDDFNDAVQPPRKKSKLAKPMELLNSKPTSQQNQEEALASPARIPEDKPRRTIPCHCCSPTGFNAVDYKNIPDCAAARGNDYTERPWVKILQWALDLSDSEVARMMPSNLLDFVSQSGRAAHVNNSGWDFLVYQPDGSDDEERRILFLGVRPELDLHL